MRTLKKDEISVKVKQVNEKGCLLLLYKTARVDAQILDETFGVSGWVNDFKEIKGNLFCGIGVKQEDGSFLWRWDCGVESATEAEKGEASDAFKRAGFKWGIGKELYTAPFIWVNVATVANKKGGYELKDRFMKFKVADIEYADGKISLLTIVNHKGEVMFSTDKNKQPKPVKNPEPTKPQKSVDERVEDFKKYLATATLEAMNSEKYKKNFKALCLLTGADLAEELNQLHNNRYMMLMQQPLEKE